MILIGLAGPDGVGKSSVARALLRHRKSGEVLAFASPMKLMLTVILEDMHVPENIIHEMLYGSRKKELSPLLGGKSPRELLRTLGTEWGRKLVHDKFWVLIAEAKILHRKQQKIDMVVFDDLRFQNEVDLIRKHRGHVFEILRPDIEYSSDHVSNNGLTFSEEQKIINLNPSTAADEIKKRLKIHV